MKKHIELLGKKAKDKVTGFTGVVTCISFDLYGCVQAIVSPPLDEKGNVPKSQWFDVTRLTVNSKKPVMDVPDFDKGYIAEGKKGCAVKPLP